jgi:hypothetical protein
VTGVMGRGELAIARTVIYAGLFDYPLTLDQLQVSLIESAQTRRQILDTWASSDALQSIVEYRDGFFFPAGRFALVAERARRETRSRAFLLRHRVLLRLVCALPFTRLVALSGSIAHDNLEEGGDLDLFIVTRGPRVWMVTVATVLLTKLLGVRPVVCANFVMSDARLALDQHDLFTANQVLHLRAISGARVLDAFLAANPFVARLYPNSIDRPPAADLLPGSRALDALKSACELLLAVPSPALEALCRFAYRRHLRRRSPSWRSPDQVRLQPDYLKLHTQSHRHSVLDRFNRAVEDAVARADSVDSRFAQKASGRSQRAR